MFPLAVMCDVVVMFPKTLIGWSILNIPEVTSCNLKPLTNNLLPTIFPLELMFPLAVMCD